MPPKFKECAIRLRPDKDASEVTFFSMEHNDAWQGEGPVRSRTNAGSLGTERPGHGRRAAPGAPRGVGPRSARGARASPEPTPVLAKHCSPKTEDPRHELSRALPGRFLSLTMPRDTEGWKTGKFDGPYTQSGFLCPESFF